MVFFMKTDYNQETLNRQNFMNLCDFIIQERILVYAWTIFSPINGKIIWFNHRMIFNFKLAIDKYIILISNKLYIDIGIDIDIDIDIGIDIDINTHTHTGVRKTCNF